MNLTELNRTAKYYRDNPDKLIGDKGADSTQPLEPINQLSYEHMRKFINKIARYQKRWEDFHDVAVPINGSLTNPSVAELFPHVPNFDDLESSVFEINRKIGYHFGMTNDAFQKLMNFVKSPDPEYFVSNAKAFDVYTDKTAQFIINDFDRWASDVKSIIATAIAMFQSISQAWIKKRAIQAGMTMNTLINVMSAIHKWKQSGGKNISRDLWPAIQRLTVIPRNLPKKIYRGIGISPPDYNYDEKHYEKWSKGNTVELESSRPTSWSASKDVAITFMDSDYLKVLLEYEITDPSVVIADLRNLPEFKYWGEMEIILSPEVTGNFKILEVLKPTEWNDFQKKVSAKKKASSGGTGHTFPGYLRHHFFNMNSLDVPTQYRDLMKSMASATVEQVENVTHQKIASQYSREHTKMYYALYHMVTNYTNLHASIIRVYSPSKALVEVALGGRAHGPKVTIELLTAKPNKFEFKVVCFSEKDQILLRDRLNSKEHGLAKKKNVVVHLKLGVPPDIVARNKAAKDNGDDDFQSDEDIENAVKGIEFG